MTLIKKLSGWPVAAVLALCALGAQAQTIKIAYIDPLSGGGATIGEHGLKHLNFLIEGMSLEVASPDEARQMLNLKGRNNVSF